MDKKGFYALMELGTTWNTGIHYFNGSTFTESLLMHGVCADEFLVYDPIFNTPKMFNERYEGEFKMEYLGE
jgi:hypothetical protein